MLNKLNITYPESDWQFFKQFLNVCLNFANYREIPYRFSRSMLAQNLVALINQGKATVLDLSGFSRQLQHDVRVLLGHDKDDILKEFHGLKIGTTGLDVGSEAKS